MANIKIKRINHAIQEELMNILFKEAKGPNTFCDLYYLKQNIDLNQIKLEDGEVEEVKYASTEEIEELYKQNQFKKGHYKMFKDCLEYLKTK